VPLLITAVVFVLALAGLGYWLRAKYVGRCSECGRGLVNGRPVRWCVAGHRLHQSCVKRAMEREICPICGIYVADNQAERGAEEPAGSV
jgi:hypothetical protein